jgi:hypothetical protein
MKGKKEKKGGEREGGGWSGRGYRCEVEEVIERERVGGRKKREKRGEKTYKV